MKIITGALLAVLCLFPKISRLEAAPPAGPLSISSNVSRQATYVSPLRPVCVVTGISYFARLGENSWSGALDHKANLAYDGNQDDFQVPEVYFPGEVTSVTGLSGRLKISAKSANCAALKPQIYVKATVPGHSDYAEDAWTKVTWSPGIVAAPPSGLSNSCVYDYSIPSSSIEDMFAAANTKHNDFNTPFGDEHYLGVVMQLDGACSGWDNRYYVIVNENSTKTNPALDPTRNWNSDLGEP